MARIRDYRAEEARRNQRSIAAGFRSRAQERRARELSKKWSDKHAVTEVAKYRPRTTAEWAKAYYNAFVNPDTYRMRATQSGPPEAVRHYLVDVAHYYSPTEWDAKYGPGAADRNRFWRVTCVLKDKFSKRLFPSESSAVEAARDHALKRGYRHICTITSFTN
jgi:hypothetical protein